MTVFRKKKGVLLAQRPDRDNPVLVARKIRHLFSGGRGIVTPVSLLGVTGEVRFVVGVTGSGKAQPLWTRVLTPDGWRNMGELKLGDAICGPDYSTQRVTGIFDQGPKQIYKVVTEDGLSTFTSGDHLFTVTITDQYGADTVAGEVDITTATIQGLLREHKRIFIPVVQAPLSSVREAAHKAGIALKPNQRLVARPDRWTLDELLAAGFIFNEETYDLSLGNVYNRFSPKQHLREIKRVEGPLGFEHCRCILTSHPKQLYVTDHYIVTHNTSLLRILHGQIRPQEGQIWLNGREMRHWPRHEWRRAVGYVSQSLDVVSTMTVLENIAYPMLLMGFSKRQAHRHAWELLRRFQLDHAAQRLANESLSGGEQQRLAILRALASDPLVLLCDEPTGHLDPIASAQVLKTLWDVAASGVAVICVTHDLETIRLTGADYVPLTPPTHSERRIYTAARF